MTDTNFHGKYSKKQAVDVFVYYLNRYRVSTRLLSQKMNIIKDLLSSIVVVRYQFHYGLLSGC